MSIKSKIEEMEAEIKLLNSRIEFIKSACKHTNTTKTPCNYNESGHIFDAIETKCADCGKELGYEIVGIA